MGMENLKKALLVAGYLNVNISSLGSERILIWEEEAVDLENLLTNDHGWLMEWLTDIKPWEAASCITKNRSCIIQIYGLPLTAWNEKNLLEISSMIGDCPHIEEITRCKGDLEKAHLLVKIPFELQVERSIWALIDGTPSLLHIKELATQSRSYADDPLASSDEEEDSQVFSIDNSEESAVSLMEPGLHGKQLVISKQLLDIKDKYGKANLQEGLQGQETGGKSQDSRIERMEPQPLAILFKEDLIGESDPRRMPEWPTYKNNRDMDFSTDNIKESKVDDSALKVYNQMEKQNQSAPEERVSLGSIKGALCAVSQGVKPLLVEEPEYKDWRLNIPMSADNLSPDSLFMGNDRSQKVLLMGIEPQLLSDSSHSSVVPIDDFPPLQITPATTTKNKNKNGRTLPSHRSLGPKTRRPNKIKIWPKTSVKNFSQTGGTQCL